MGLFSISEEESDYFEDNVDFIELKSCSMKEKFCTEHLYFVNEKMRLSRTYWINKEFSQAIGELKVAFFKTFEINSPSCFQCAELFRSTIIKSLEALHKDLRPVAVGFIKMKRHDADYELATAVLDEFLKMMSSTQTV